MSLSKSSLRWTKAVVWLACLVPAAMLLWRFSNSMRGIEPGLGGNPVEYITHRTGDWTIRLLLVTLSITPLRKIFNLPDLIRYRRLIGLFAFFYGTLHLLTYVWLDQFFNLQSMLKDVAKRPFITVGTLGFVCLLLLALTSTAGWIRRMGGKNWQRLHKLVYVAGIAGVVHYYWLVKSDVRLPLLYGAILALLLGWRAVQRRSPAKPAVPVQASAR